MKAQQLTFLIFLFIILSSCCCKNVRQGWNSNEISGNGKVITKKIDVKDYDRISMRGSVDLVYEQKAGKPYLEVTVDENIFEHIRIEVNGSELSVGPQDGVNLRPTVWKVKTNSHDLVGFQMRGSGMGELNNIQNTRNLNLSASGSGRIVVHNLQTGNLSTELSGSGKIDVQNATLEAASGRISGSGNFTLNGSGREGSFSVSGSGKVYAYDYLTNNVDVSVSGSGSIYLTVSDMLKARISGSGGVYYKGNPQLDSHTSGSGRIRNMN